MSENGSEEDTMGDFREVDPMEVIEDRLMLLEAWLQEDPFQEEVTLKREEYLSLMTELEIIGKKMRKTDKLLAVPNQPNRAKLERKRDQYTREVQDIVMYAEQDQFFNFEEEGEHAEAALNAYMRANSLLGKPLETLAEMTGFEDSATWNDSGNVLDFRSAQGASNNNSSSNLERNRPHNITILKKKLKKVKQLMEEASTEKERKKLLKKHQEYKAALEEITFQEEDHQESEESSNASEESMEPLQESPVKKVMRKAEERKSLLEQKQREANAKNPDEAYVMLKRKLTKAMRLAENAKSDEEQDKFDRKVDEYLDQLEEFEAWDSEKIQFGFGDVADDIEVDQLKGGFSAMDGSMNAAELARGGGGGGGLDASEVQLLQKKLKKIDKMIKEQLERDGDDARTTKEFKKMQKKRKQYISQLADDQFSVSGNSLGGSSVDLTNSISQMSLSSMASGDISLSSLNASNIGLNGSTHSSRRGLVITEEDAKLIQKKLKKVQKLLAEATPGSKEHAKLQKKRQQYMADLESVAEE
eukprot:Nitzschia sp. Nitz4//scaffold460_size6035//3536//5125//NITZ4_009192-RA/size6035-processed-gene-0.0-mRNA-1//1//CDS//3329552486//1937//frame0